MKKALFLFGAICLGIFIPQASQFSFLIYYLLMIMLFFPFLDWKISHKVLTEKRVYLVLLLNVSVGLIGYFLLKDYDQTLAFIAFLVGITPTATACPAVLSYLKGRVHFAISAVIVTNIFMSIFLPLVIWQISNIQVEISSILGRTLILIFSPLLLGQLIQHYSPKIKKTFLEFKTFGFYAWLLVCFIAVGKASDFIRNSATDLNQIIIIGVLAAFICLLSFNLGRFAGGKDFALEGSQTMGQKNTILTLWMSLTYFNPVIALGPIFYLVFHNLYNSYQLAMLAKRERVSQP